MTNQIYFSKSRKTGDNLHVACFKMICKGFVFLFYKNFVKFTAFNLSCQPSCVIFWLKSVYQRDKTLDDAPPVVCFCVDP